MNPTTDEVDGTSAVFVANHWPFSEIEIIQEINSWGPGEGREEFDHALENGMIQADPKSSEHDYCDLYRPTPEGLGLFKAPGSKACTNKEVLSTSDVP